MQFTLLKNSGLLYSIFPGFFFKQRRFLLSFFLPATEPAEERQRPAQDGERRPRQADIQALHRRRQVLGGGGRSPSPDVLLINLFSKKVEEKGKRFQ